MTWYERLLDLEVSIGGLCCAGIMFVAVLTVSIHAYNALVTR